MDEQLKKVRKAYDRTVEEFRHGIDPYENIPDDIRSTDFYRSLPSAGSLNSSADDIKDFLSPKPGMRFLDAGCSANLANYNLGQWPSAYYGVDISPALIEAMKNYTERNSIIVGGLYTSEIAELPFDDNYFDIAAVIGVLEYCTLGYIERSLTELNRVLKPGSKAAIDIPNASHPYAADMQKMEEYLKRPIFLHPRVKFEDMLTRHFSIIKTDASLVMIKYLIRS